MSLVALGVCGGIGAYKAVEVARGLQKRGHEVAAVMTRSAQRFVGPVTFEAITRRRVITTQWSPGANADIEHIALATDAALLLVAPATANIIGKFAAGIADDFLSALYLATRAPVLLAPAMNTNMLEHDAVRANLQTLSARGVRFVDPGAGYLACGWIGKGRLSAVAPPIPPPAISPAAGSARAGSPSPTRSSKPPNASSSRRARCSAGSSWSRPARLTKTSTTCATSATDRADEWGMRWRPRR